MYISDLRLWAVYWLLKKAFAFEETILELPTKYEVFNQNKNDIFQRVRKLIRLCFFFFCREALNGRTVQFSYGLAQ